ncbi:MAG: LCP family protein, partial [Pseudonocardiales bacterium]
MTASLPAANQRPYADDEWQPPRRRGRAGKVFLVVLLLVLAAVAGVAYRYVHAVTRFDAKVARNDPFAGLTDRPGAGVAGAQNFLLIGSDSRDNRLPAQATNSGGQRSDSLILFHVNANHTKAYMVSIPRDSYVYVPPGGPWQGGRTKINAAFAYGGPRLVVQTVEGFTGVKIDHVVMINFAGFKKMTDAVGGVDVVVNQTVTDPETHATFKKGVNHLDGDAALLYVRQRHGLPGGDFDRVKRQQQFIRALLATATARGTLANPNKLSALLDATADAIVVDKDLSMGKTAVAFRGLRTSDLSFITTPNRGTGRVGEASVVIIDKEKASALFSAMNADTVDDWLKT